ncbi:MAG: hypothetical protein AAF697_10975 [Pseudomonadota bacterium]
MLETVVSDYRGVLQDAMVILICGAALIWGNAPERAAAAVWLVFFEFAKLLYRSVFGADAFQLMSMDAYLTITDILAGVFWVAIALYANRNYTMWLAGLQLLAICAHLARGLSDLISPLAYIVMVVAPGWLQLIVLAIGLIRHIRRKRIYGPYRDWRLNRSPAQFAPVAAKAGVQGTWAPDTTHSWRDDLK